MTIWQRWKQTALHNKALVLSSVLMAFGTLFYSGAAIVQIWMFERSSKQASDQADKLIIAANKIQDAAGKFSGSARGIYTGVSNAVNKLQLQVDQVKRSANATEDAVGATQAQMRVDQRAWLAVKAVHGTKPDEKTSFISLIDVTNTGRTPAKNVVIYPSYVFTPPEIPVTFDDKVTPKPLGLLSPGTDRTITFNASDSPQVGKEPPSFFLSRRIYAYGKITYDDIFGEQHWVTYCSRVSDDWTVYQFCEEHNDADSKDPQKAPKPKRK